MGWMLKIPKFQEKNSRLFLHSAKSSEAKALGCTSLPCTPKICVFNTHTSFIACVLHTCTPDFPNGNSVLLSEL